MTPNSLDADFKQQVLTLLTDIQVGTEKRLTYLETHDREVFGNGQPGWKAKTDERLKWLEGKLFMAIGGGMVLGVLFHFAVDLWKK